jgi:Tol biopolymer transport system component
VEVAPDGKRFVCAIANARGIDELWVSSLDHPEFARLGLDPNADCYSAIWSPDGRRIAYDRRGKDGRDGIYVQNTDGGEAKMIHKTEAEAIMGDYPSSWLTDGSAIVLTRRTPDRSSIMLLPLGEAGTNAAQPRALLPTDFNRYLPRLSPDGRLMAYASDENGRSQTWLAELRAGAVAGRPLLVRNSRGPSVAGGIPHAWAADGKTLFIQDEHDRLLKFAISNGPPISVSAPVEVADLDKLKVQCWSPLPDARFLVTLKNENEEDIRRYNLVLNWAEVLKKKVPIPR